LPTAAGNRTLRFFIGTPEDRMDLNAARDQMVSQQLRTWEVLDPHILDLFDRLPREDFVPPGYAQLAYADMQIPLGEGQVMMTPIVEGRLLQAFGFQGHERVLEIGTGSGFLTACLATLSRSVVSLDCRADFLERADAALHRAGLSNVILEQQDANLLETTDAYDAVVVTASVPKMRTSFLQALRAAGKAVVIVGEMPIMEARLYRRCGADQWSEESLFETAIPTLDGSDARGFIF
jgi:protein-L-isoaspartate(D-aspartate) O-methyltransferase